MKRTVWACALASTLVWGACSSDSSGSGSGNGTGGSTGSDGEPQYAVDIEKQGVAGTVVDSAGAPLSGVTVTSNGESATTDAEGAFLLELATNGRVVLDFSATGYVPIQKPVTVLDGASRLEVTLLAEAAAQPLDADAGGTITAARGAQLVANAAAFVDASGNPVTGQVDVHLTPFDPSVASELDAYPGDSSAEQADGTMVSLETFGVLDVTVRQNGQKLQVKDGETITISIPVASNQTDPPATMALWSFDEAKGMWKEEGMATYDAATKTYVGEIAHMSPWNVDIAMTVTCLRGAVQDNQGAVFPGAQVVASGLDYNGKTYATSDADGVFCINVRENSSVKVTAIHPAGGGASQDIDDTGNIPASVPPQCTETSCTEIPDPFVITPNVITSTDSDGNTVAKACSDVKAPLTGTCAADMNTFFDCFQPSGECEISMTGVSFGNGAQATFDMNGESIQYFGPGGQSCGSATFEENAESTTFTLANGTTYQIAETENGNEITCPSGEKVTLTPAEVDAYEACVGGTEGFGECTNNVTGSCSTDAECASGFECCASQCLPSGTCGAAGLCETDADCDGGLQCCDIQGFQVCAPQCP